MREGDVVQFNESHEWCGCLGIIEEMKGIHNTMLSVDGVNDYRFLIGVPVPKGGTAYVFVMASEFAIERIGKARLVPKKESDEE